MHLLSFITNFVPCWFIIDIIVNQTAMNEAIQSAQRVWVPETKALCVDVTSQITCALSVHYLEVSAEMRWLPSAVLLLSAYGCLADEHNHVVSAIHV